MELGQGLDRSEVNRSGPEWQKHRMGAGLGQGWGKTGDGRSEAGQES